MLRPVVLYPDPILKKKSRVVTEFDADLKALAADMAESLRDAEGIGLAGVQVGVLLRIMAMDAKYDQEDRGEPLILINPEILEKSGAEVGDEGCLSLPDIREDVERATRVKVKTQDVEGKNQVYEFTGILARCIQHETDHMNGHLFIEKVPAVKRILMKTKLKRLEKQYKTAHGKDA